MIRAFLYILLGLFALAAGALAAALWPPRELPAVYAGNECRRLALVDGASGREVVGAEDIALSPDGATLFVSAHDRRSGTPETEGALYAVPVAALAGAATVTVESLTAGMDFPGGFRPHGIAVLDEGEGSAVLAAVNRAVREGEGGAMREGGEGAVQDGAVRESEDGTVRESEDGTAREGENGSVRTGEDRAVREGGAVRPDSRVELFRASPDGTLEHLLGVADPLLCRANDLAFAGPSALVVTRDRQRCEGFGWRDLLGGDGELLRLRLRIGPASVTAGAPETIAGGIDFANGVVADPGPPARLLVAATRGGEILAYPLERATAPLGRVPGARRAAPLAAIPLPGGPDNLSRTEDGRIVAAVLPSLPRATLYLFRVLGRDSAPSRIVAVEPDGETVTVLYDDPAGRLFSAATSAVLAGDTLVAGSLGDAGLLVCRKAPA